MAGGVLALFVASARGYAKTAVKNVGTILRLWSMVGVQPVEGLTLADTSSVRLPVRATAGGGDAANVMDAVIGLASAVDHR